MIDPNGFIITRKRKKFKFAHFANADNCFELANWSPLDQKGLIVEIGAGTALFLVELASRHPDKTFIAIDVKADRLQKGAREALDRGLKNIYFVRARADQLAEVVKSGSVGHIWLTFSDPFPKKRDAKRRLTAPSFLKIYRRALGKQGRLYQKTDNHSLFDWSLEQLVANGWTIVELSYDLHDSDFPSDYKITTSYEDRFRAEGLVTYFVCAR